MGAHIQRTEREMDVMDALMFQAEVKRNEKLLFRIAWSYLIQAQDVEDVVQDALMIAWEKRDTLRNPDQFRPWISRIVTNQCINVLRKRRRFSFFPLEEDTVALEMPEAYSPLTEAMNRLKPDQRIVILLHYADGYSVQDISNLLGIPTGTVQTRLHRARKHLKKALQVEWEEA